jgi:hypothetical protein
VASRDFDVQPKRRPVGNLTALVSKRRDAPYRSGEYRDWRKVKTAAWLEANRDRWRLFESN